MGQVRTVTAYVNFLLLQDNLPLIIFHFVTSWVFLFFNTLFYKGVKNKPGETTKLEKMLLNYNIRFGMNFILRNIVRFIKLFYFKFLKYEKEKLSHSFKKGRSFIFFSKQVKQSVRWKVKEIRMIMQFE